MTIYEKIIQLREKIPCHLPKASNSIKKVILNNRAIVILQIQYKNLPDSYVQVKSVQKYTLTSVTCKCYSYQ